MGPEFHFFNRQTDLYLHTTPCIRPIFSPANVCFASSLD